MKKKKKRKKSAIATLNEIFKEVFTTDYRQQGLIDLPPCWRRK